MAGRGNKKQSRINDENRKWSFAVYGRRSFDDGENSESYTIKNQKALIESYLENKPNIVIEDYYVDDGYTGTNFERPGFKRMLQDVGPFSIFIIYSALLFVPTTCHFHLLLSNYDQIIIQISFFYEGGNFNFVGLTIYTNFSVH